ncbi:hypothetical protein ABK040_004650 [Willaertia magna]
MKRNGLVQILIIVLCISSFLILFFSFTIINYSNKKSIINSATQQQYSKRLQKYQFDEKKFNVFKDGKSYKEYLSNELNFLHRNYTKSSKSIFPINTDVPKDILSPIKKSITTSKILNQNNDYYDVGQASFLLENVCLNYRGELVFLTNLENYQNFLKEKFENKIISCLQSWRASNRGYMKLKFKIVDVTTSNPKDIDFSEVNFIQKPVVLALRYATGNFGHMLVDNLVSIFELITKYNFNANDIGILFMDEIFYRDIHGNRPYHENFDDTCEGDDIKKGHFLLVNKKTKGNYFCQEEYAAYGYKKETSVKYSLNLAKMITKNEILQLCSYKVKEKNDILYRVERAPCFADDYIARNSEKDLNVENIQLVTDMNQQAEKIHTCFSKLMFGTGDRAMVPDRPFSRNRELAITLLRKQIYYNLGIKENDKNKNSKRQVKIGIHQKAITERHGGTIYNLQNLTDYLTENLKTQFESANLEIIPIVLENYKIVEQVELFSKLDIYISTSGSGAMYSLFMPMGSLVIYSPTCQYTDQTNYACNPPLMHILNTFSHVTVVDATNLMGGCVFNGIGHPCEVILDLEKTLKMVTNYLKMKL